MLSKCFTGYVAAIVSIIRQKIADFTAIFPTRLNNRDNSNFKNSSSKTIWRILFLAVFDKLTVFIKGVCIKKPTSTFNNYINLITFLSSIIICNFKKVMAVITKISMNESQPKLFQTFPARLQSLVSKHGDVKRIRKF